MEIINGIGFAENGGFVIAKHLHSPMHADRYIAVVLALASDVAIVDMEGNVTLSSAALIPPGVAFRLDGGSYGTAAFLHLDPFTDAGMLQVVGCTGIRPLDRSRFPFVLQAIETWMGSEGTKGEGAAKVMDLLVTTLLERDLRTIPLDPRVMRCIEFIKHADIDEVTLTNAAKVASVSPGRLSHLFRNETGGTFREYVLHQKLVRSLRSIHGRHRLTTASHSGGFTDQPHFTHAFRKAFGIRPSSVKS